MFVYVCDEWFVVVQLILWVVVEFGEGVYVWIVDFGYQCCFVVLGLLLVDCVGGVGCIDQQVEYFFLVGVEVGEVGGEFDFGVVGQVFLYCVVSGWCCGCGGGSGFGGCFGVCWCLVFMCG